MLWFLLTTGPVILKASPLFKVEVLSVSSKEVPLDEKFTVSVAVTNSGPCDLTCDSIWLTLVDCAPELVEKRVKQLKHPVTRQGSNTSLDNRLVKNVSSVKKDSPVSLNLKTHFEGSPSDPLSSGITCINSHELLKRHDSTGGVLRNLEEKIVKDQTSQRAMLEEVVLKPGVNEITFTFEVSVKLCSYL